MSDVKRFRADHRHVVETEFDDAQYVGVEDYDAKCHSAEVYFGSWKRTEEERDAAQVELAALREELQTRTADLLQCGTRRKAAEQRNATLTEALQDLLKGSGNSPGANKRYAKARAALKPIESGASE